MPHPLETILNNKIAVDTRPRSQIDRFQAGAGRKRTTIRAAHVIEVGGTIPVKQLMLSSLANAGITIRGVLKQGPLLRSAIKQGTLADCFELSTMTGLALSYPTWLDDYIILPVTLADGTPGVVVNFYEAKTVSIVQITTSLEVSTSYNNPSDEDIRPEIIEKCYGFFRSGVADYLKNAWGNGFEVGIAFGFKVTATRYPSQTTPLPSAFIDLHRGANRIVMILTSPPATALIGSHAYAGKDGRNAINPWDASVDTPVTDATLGSSGQVSAIYALEPAGILPKLPTQIIPLPDPKPPAVPVSPPPTPSPTPPTSPSTPSPTPEPEKPAMLELEVSTDAGVNIFGAQTEATVTVDRNRVLTLAWTSNADSVETYNDAYKTRTPHAPNGDTLFSVQLNNVVTFTAIKGSEKLVKTLTIKVAGNTSPSPTPPATPTNPAKKPAFILYDDHTWGNA